MTWIRWSSFVAMLEDIATAIEDPDQRAEWAEMLEVMRAGVWVPGEVLESAGIDPDEIREVTR